MAKTDTATGVSISEGWRFYTADFSREGRIGSVMLKRDAAGEKWFYSLSEAGQETTDLFVTGFGQTVTEAVIDANKKITPIVTGSEAA